MYFVVGFPKILAFGKDEPILAIKYSADGAFIATLTATSVVIWSGDLVSSFCYIKAYMSSTA